MSETQAVLEASAVAITQKVTYSAGATSFFAFIAKVDVIAWGGLTVAVVGLIIQFYFQFSEINVNKLSMKCAQRNINNE